MSTRQKYYEILGLSPFAGRKEIAAAIARLRQKDSEGHYDVTLNRIEKSLLPQKAVLSQVESAQTSSQEKRNDDNAPPTVREEASNHETEKRHLQDAAAPISPPDPVVHKPSQFYQYDDDASTTGRKKKIIIAGLLLIVLTAVIIASKFIYEYLENREQARQASNALFNAKEHIEAYIREHKTFPTTFSFHVADTAPYTLRLQNKKILLTFNRNATAVLQNRQISLTEVDQPDVGLIWQCDVLPGFPERYRPENCY